MAKNRTNTPAELLAKNAKAVVAFFTPVLVSLQHALQSRVVWRTVVAAGLTSLIGALVVWAVPNKK